MHVLCAEKDGDKSAYPWRLDGGDEELGAVGVAPGVGHGQEAGGGVLVHEVLIYINSRLEVIPTAV
jgi:hypothetical protein